MCLCIYVLYVLYVYAHKYVAAKVKVEYLFLSCFLSHFWKQGLSLNLGNLALNDLLKLTG